ncbi:MAG: MBL fold metallo-hydrolase [Deltaproteobacteria bacterium]|nr:MBL fold metallo-hydrolase [Deltaproteobacteria bacterium]
MRLLLPLVTVAFVAACSGPTLLDIDPKQVAAGGVVVVEGQGFDDSLALRLEGGGGSITLAVSLVTPSSASGTLPANTPGGEYDVVAVTAGGEARLVAGLTVVAGQLEVFFIDVGQGDATLLIAPDGSTLLVDGGPPEAVNTVRRFIDDTGGRLDRVAVTHTHADHLGGMVGVLRGVDNRAGTDDDIVPGLRWIGHDDDVCDSQLCDDYRALVGAPFEKPAIDTVLDFGGATITVVARDADVGSGPFSVVDDPNSLSLALLVEFGGRSLFLGGDTTGGGIGTVDIETAIAAKVGPVDVLHLNHHGSRTSSSTGFLQALQPRAVIVSVGTDNSFCHPDSDVIDRLIDLGIPAFATGAGMVDDLDRCDGLPTLWPANAREGLGTFSLVIAADGALTLGGEPL